MKKISILATILISTILPSALLYAKAPYVEAYYIDYPKEGCLKRASDSIMKAGFHMKKGTWEGYDRVGFKGEYKAVVSCVKEKHATAIIVAGPVYKQTNQYAIEIRNNFKHWSKTE